MSDVEFNRLAANGEGQSKRCLGCPLIHRFGNTLLSLVVAMAVILVFVKEKQKLEQQHEQQQLVIAELMEQVNAQGKQIESLESANRARIYGPKAVKDIQRENTTNSVNGDESNEDPADTVSHSNCNCTTAQPQSNATTSPLLTKETEKLVSTSPTAEIEEIQEYILEATNCHEKVVKQEEICGNSSHQVITSVRFDQKNNQDERVKLIVECCDMVVKIAPKR